MKECQAENKELRNKVKILEDFVTSHIAADVPTTFDTAVPDASSTYATVASALVSTSHVSLRHQHWSMVALLTLSFL